MYVLHRFRLVWLTALLLTAGGCLRSHRVQSQLSTAPLQEATKQQLVDRIDREAAKIRTLNLTVDISTSVGGQMKGKITEYQSIHGYILVRKPDMMRMIGLFPVVRNRAFDMVSNGDTFRLSIPAKNRFVIGHNAIIHPTVMPSLENLRPQHIFDALLLREIDPKNEIVVLRNDKETVNDPKTKRQLLQSDYVLIVIRRMENDWFLSREITFSRTDLQPHRQVVYDKNGYVASDVTYSNFQDYSGLSFPADIHIWRPQEEYAIGLHILKLLLNAPLSDEQFVLNQPPGSQLVNLDTAPGTASAGNGSKSPQ